MFRRVQIARNAYMRPKQKHVAYWYVKTRTKQSIRGIIRFSTKQNFTNLENNAGERTCVENPM